MKDKHDENTIEMSKIYNVLNTQNRLCYQQGICSCLLCTVVSFRMDRTYNISKLQKLNLPSKEHTLPFYGCTGRIFLVLITNLRFFVVFMEPYIQEKMNQPDDSVCCVLGSVCSLNVITPELALYLVCLLSLEVLMVSVIELDFMRFLCGVNENILKFVLYPFYKVWLEVPVQQ